MNHINIFLNTEVKNSGILPIVADFTLSPVRYFFGGRKVKIVTNQGQQHVHHVASYKGKDGFFSHISKTDYTLSASSRGFLKALTMATLLAPGLILGTVAKSFAYLSKEMRERHNLANRHFTPVNKTVGSEDNRLNEKEIRDELTKLKNDPLHQKVKNLIIYGNGSVTFNTDPGFVSMNPKKVIMVGAKVIHASSATTRLDDTLAARKGWLSSLVRVIGSRVPADNSTHVTQWKVSSVKEALQHRPPRRSLASFKRYHIIYQVNG